MKTRRGFTLLELIVVIIIIAVLASLGFTQYTKVVEKGRTAEAKMILGQLRSAQYAFNLEYPGYTTVANLPVGAPTTGPACTDSTQFFYYSCDTGTGTCIANRCTSGGKSPAGPTYNINLTIGGVWGGTAGYY